METQHHPKDEQHNDKHEKPFFKLFFEASFIGMYLVIATFVGFGMGYLLDKAFGTSPWLTFGMMILGIIAGFREILRVVNKQNR
ncbi:MAG: AtpZ/AtpI family protein [Nitrospiraceae bacterium]|nr:AtpZ/AtpI family protein [Nitrospiraceae bacterium]